MDLEGLNISWNDNINGLDLSYNKKMKSLAAEVTSFKGVMNLAIGNNENYSIIRIGVTCI